MANASASHPAIENPGKLQGAGALTGLFGAFIAVGIISFFAMYGSDHAHAWSAILRSHFYFLTIVMGAMFFLAVNWITTSMWSAPVRRIAEGFTAYIPVMLVTSLLIFLGSKSLFQWTDVEAVKNDPVVAGKLGYLNMPFFVIRTLVSVIGWVLFAKVLVGGSLSTDTGSNENYIKVYHRSRKVGVVFLIFFAISFSMAAFDMLMSLDPHFFSTMFAVYTFGGAFQSFYAMFAVVVILMKRNGKLGHLVNENHLHDIAKMMFAFTVFWAYTGFSQYMLIWYANLPEETGYFILRFNAGWEPWTLGLFIAKFFVPFFLLLPRGNKRSEVIVFMTAIWILGTQYLDLNWMIQPQLYHDGPVFSVWDIGVWLGFLGMFGLAILSFYKKNNLVAIKDPYLADSVYHHHI